jgi:hypothetical protein
VVKALPGWTDNLVRWFKQGYAINLKAARIYLARINAPPINYGIERM